jgi:serine/threonine-protein kinase
LFSLGVVLYEMLTGFSPFASQGDSLQNVCNHVLSSTPQPPSHANPSIPAALNEIIAACLAKDPHHRIQSAEVLADQLFPLARRKPGTQPAAPPEPTLRSRTARFLRSA